MFWYYFIKGEKEHILDIRCLENELLCMSEKLFPKFIYCGYKLINNSIYFLNTKNFLPNVKGNKQTKKFKM